MEFVLICSVALLGSLLTFYSGFGLGTLLLPCFSLFFPVPLAIALTAVVHFLNNIFKLFLVGKYASRSILLKFGVPSIVAAILGAYLLNSIERLHPLYEYTINNHLFSVTSLKLIIAFILFFFSIYEINPKLSKITFDQKYLPIGGLLSGFFGGLSGNQGALRSAFLIKSNLSKESYIATGVLIACMIDISRLSIYSKQFYEHANVINYNLLIAAVLAAFLGAYIGSKLLKKVTLKNLQIVVATMLILFSIALGTGLL